MTKNAVARLALSLPLEDQLEIAQTLWDHAAPKAEGHLSPELVQLLEARRLEALGAPEAGVPWEEVKARLSRRA